MSYKLELELELECGNLLVVALFQPISTAQLLNMVHTSRCRTFLCLFVHFFIHFLSFFVMVLTKAAAVGHKTETYAFLIAAHSNRRSWSSLVFSLWASVSATAYFAVT
jgi:ABC-type sulfate transport system permease component